MENNYNEFLEGKDLESLKLERLRDAKKSYNKLFLSFIAYLFLLNIVQGILFQGESNGLFMMITTIVSALILVFFNKNKISLKSVLNEKRSDTSPYSFLSLVGIEIFLTLVFSLIGKGLTSLLPFETPNVTSDIITSESLGLYIYACLTGPFTEELIFRGYFRRKLSKYGPLVSIFASGLLFSIMHLNLPQSVGIFGAAMVLGYAGHFYSFKTAVLMHMSSNTLVTILGYLENKSSLGFHMFSLLYLALMLLGIFALYKNRKKIKENLFAKETDKFYFKAYFKNYGLYIFLLVFIPLIIFLPLIMNQASL